MVGSGVRFDEAKIREQAPALLNVLARLVGALINEERIGVTHSPATRVELGNAVAIIMRVRAEEPAAEQQKQ